MMQAYLDLRIYLEIDSLWAAVHQCRELHQPGITGDRISAFGAPFGSPVLHPLDDALLSGSSANRLWRAAWNSSTTSKDTRLGSSNVRSVRKLCSWPQVLQCGIPDFCGLIHAQVRRHQVKPTVDDS